MSRALKIWSVPTILLVSAGVAIGVFSGGSSRSASWDLRPGDSEFVRRGAEVYEQNCASCHGVDLKGQRDWQSGNADGTLKAPPHDETGHTWHHDDELLFRLTKFGTVKALDLKDFNSNMPAFEGTLNDADIVAVLSWIKAQWPKEIQERHDMMNERKRSNNQ
ncbi:MAG: cytochrome c [Roseibium aggregatum]|jgi:mono/diheme cytochrome c family protein|uniref:c-type cytochrome n=1 Tax=uncultured Roseibium sp. TaxID=1936171 RepID=UPI002629765C|nr:cytochrome c [uncultured Roseibium sp.]